MPPTDHLIPFLLTVGVIELTPGPNMGYLALVASRWGWRAGLFTVAGVTLGLAIYLAASIAGLAEAARRWPWLLEVLRWAGVVYLLWLALEALRTDHRSEAAPVSVSGLFSRGLIANLLNPKAAIFYAALLPNFVDPTRSSLKSQALILGGLHLLISVVVHGGIVLAAARGGPALRRWNDAGGRRRRQKAFALALAFLAGWMALTDLS